MLKQALSSVVAVSALIAAGAVSAGETNPLHPAYAHFTAQANVQSGGGSVAIAKNPLSPSYYQWNVSAKPSGKSIDIVINNPLHPSFERS
jgi:hypothetical protein